MSVEFTAHNIRMDDGTLTKPEAGPTMDANPFFLSVKRLLETVFPGDKKHLRLLDVGCLEGAYAVEFARMGFQVLGVEVREASIAACNYVKSKTNLPNLTFAQDNAWNIANYGTFDVVFCCGLLYHLDQPKKFLEIVSSVTKKLMVLPTHFSTDSGVASARRPAWLGKLFARKAKLQPDQYNLSPLCSHEGLAGRWFTEFADEEAFRKRADSKWSSWDNKRSFWIQREYLLQAIHEAGFDLVMEQFDGLGPKIAEDMLHGYYATHTRGTFVGIKTQPPAQVPVTG